MDPSNSPAGPKPAAPQIRHHRVVYNTLLDRILSGQYANGSKLPTQEEICRELKVSRPTVIHALSDLKAHGHIRSIQGSGSYVNLQRETDVRLGLIIPGTSHDELDSIFPRLQHQIMREASRLGWQLIMGQSEGANYKEAATRHPVELARHLIKSGVRAAIFTPHSPEGRGEAFNTNVLVEFAQANVPVVLLDRDIVEHPRRSAYDLVCMDNLYAGQIVGKHLLSVGAKRIVFVCGQYRFSSPSMRFEGLRRTLEKTSGKLIYDEIFYLSPDDPGSLRSIIQKARPDAVVCDNDYTAAVVMKEVLAMDLDVPRDLKLASFDDAPVARVLPTTLTTVSQPVDALAFKAIETLRDRSDRPDLPPVTVQIQCKLIIRESTRGKDPVPVRVAAPGRKPPAEASRSKRG